ncbi:MAG TPA: F0F1 ATP synthase subunit delta [Gammaproteobacteria bacterium]|nr:F0F1 ATP synthase subunit delta [Gammaproteobacteria bacterium]
MELTWSTFLLEIINFLVLVWILKRFFYKPVLDVIARRRAGIEERLAEARQLHDEADTLKKEYENRLADWEKERQQARDVLSREMDEEKSRQMEALQTLLAQEREKAKVADLRQREEALREIEHRAMQQAGEFAGRLLAQASGPDLDARLLDIVLEGLSELTRQQISALRNQWGEPPETILVTSACPLAEDRRHHLQQLLQKITGLALPVEYQQDADLMAGLRITIGAWVLDANIKDDLKGFTEFAHAAK